MKIGIIQSRGLGDIVIALPIARFYHQQGHDIHWAICAEFIPHVEPYVPWITWHALRTDQGSFFLEQPRAIYQRLGIDQELCLYQALTGQSFHERVWFQHTGFDQYKYIQAGVPFDHKWQLEHSITRRPDREQPLLDLIRQNLDSTDQPYILVHLDGSDHRAEFDTTILPPDIPVIEITALTHSVFDWLTAIEQAHCVICVDSVFSNVIDQMALLDADSRYFIPRSHIGLTPVLGQHWHWLENLQLNPQHKTIRVNQ